jgi:hypothetical protein
MVNTPPDPASANLEKARAIAATDGNAFHAKVATYFRQKGWDVLISPYYVDNATGQAREIDLLCELPFTFPMQDDDGGYGIYRIQLFVECKYIDGPVVFWFDKRDHDRAVKWLDERTPFTRGQRLALRKHRYMSGGSHVAKLFSTDKKQQDRGHDPIYKALAQSLGALIQRRNGHALRDLAHEDETAEEMTVQYPVIVCSDSATFYRTDIDEHPSAMTPEQHLFQLEVDYAYTNKDGIAEEYFLIDVLRFKGLDHFMQVIGAEAQEAQILMGR